MDNGTKLRLLREHHGYSQEYVANELDISQSTYFKLESGQTKLTVERAKQLAKLYNISPEYFLSDDNQSFYYNNGNGNYNNSIAGNFENFINFNASNSNCFNEFKTQVDELRKELNELKDGQRTLIKLLDRYLKQK